jgi:hypothetical protein
MLQKAMYKIILFASCVLFSQGLFADTFSSPEDAVNTYITGVKTGSGKHINMAFADSASIQYYDEEGKFRIYAKEEFAKLVDTGNEWGAKIEITNMKKTKYAANATVEFTWGQNNKKGYVDYLNLIYIDGSWRISDKVAQYVER